jgi:hypothetical protein
LNREGRKGRKGNQSKRKAAKRFECLDSRLRGNDIQGILRLPADLVIFAKKLYLLVLRVLCVLSGEAFVCGFKFFCVCF